MKTRTNRWGDPVVKKNFELPEKKYARIKEISQAKGITDTAFILQAIDKALEAQKESN